MEDRLELLYPFWMEKSFRAVRLFQLEQMKVAGINLTSEQLTVLLAIHEYDGASQREIAEFCYKDAANIKRIIDRLIQEKLVSKEADEEDHRRQHLHSNTKGKEIVKHALEPLHNAIAEGSKNISDRELQAMISCMRKIFANFETK